MNDTVWASLISAASGILGAIVGGYFTVKGAIKAVERSSQDLESAEIRRQRIECLVALTGLRFVIANNVVAPDEYKSRFMYEMNRIPALWADDSDVMKNLRDFHADKPEKKDERFCLLLRNLARTTKVSTELLSDSDLRNVLLLPLGRR